MRLAELAEKYGIDPLHLPAHIAIIMDGNGRWAQARKRPRLFGHKAGADSVEEIVSICCQLGIPALTLYAFSSENWKRPKAEVSGLMSILQKYLRAELPKMQKNNIRLHCIGDIERLPSAVRDTLLQVMGETAKNTGMILSLALSYGGRDEICRAIKKISAECVAGDLEETDITPDLLSDYLDTAILPEPDLLIRTGGESRLSNFLLWQLSYAELYFTDIMWPEFRTEQLATAIASFQERERRFGKIGAQLNKNK
ncbi:isoprenyl transferase [Desulfotalea psychrophila]|nr:isoprenyl transferase [Desulfotalea psychrophila]